MINNRGWSAFIVLIAVVSFMPSGHGEDEIKAARVQSVIDELVAREHDATAPRRYQISEDELNAYLIRKLRERPPRGVEDVKVQLREGSFLTRLEVDLDKVQIPEGAGSSLLLAFLSGRQNLEILGRLQGEGGRATYTIEEARLNSYSLPVSIVRSILRSAAKKQDPPFDPTEPFNLPYGIQRLEVRTGKVTVHR